jgi:hypothetical protein
VVAQRATWSRAVVARQTPHAKPVDVSTGRVLSIAGVADDTKKVRTNFRQGTIRQPTRYQ